ncbi:hypothetical protein NT6N_08170 [Oceaniferula spumae]|uniref:YtxH domain-containing protein n=1 Tax=Oceaniferula spumae TaxID=2979115 RepID=A0AAT9FIK4_9BACT
MKNTIKPLFLILLGAAGLFAFSACEKKGPAEKAGEKIDKSIEKAGDKIEDATDR